MLVDKYSWLHVSVCVQLFSIYSYVGLSFHRCLNYVEAVTAYFSRAFSATETLCVSFAGK